MEYSRKSIWHRRQRERHLSSLFPVWDNKVLLSNWNGCNPPSYVRREVRTLTHRWRLHWKRRFRETGKMLRNSLSSIRSLLIMDNSKFSESRILWSLWDRDALNGKRSSKTVFYLVIVIRNHLAQSGPLSSAYFIYKNIFLPFDNSNFQHEEI